MTNHQQLIWARTIVSLAVMGFGFLFPSVLKADVVILQNGSVITGHVLQSDTAGVLVQMDSGTYRYPLDLIKEVKTEAAIPPVAATGSAIPNWAQIVSQLATNTWANDLRQVPATVINYGAFNRIPYLSFRAASGGYEVNIFGDLNAPVAVQIGAMTYLKDNPSAKSNCVDFICSILTNPAARKAVRSLDWNQKETVKLGGMTFETILPGEWGSYGGWWVTVKNLDALASAQASEAELVSLTQSPAAEVPPPPSSGNSVEPVTAQPVTTTSSTTSTSYETYNYYNAYPTYWHRDELTNARPLKATTDPVATEARPNAAVPANAVYPRSYSRTAGIYGRPERRR
jgi:hypothetical protein